MVFRLFKMAESVMADAPEKFAEKMEEVVTHTALGLAISVGHRLGLIKTMVNFTEPKTSAEIAAKAVLTERYVREWLAIMVTSQIFTMSKEDNTYFLPRSRIPYFSNDISKLLFEEFCVMFPKIEPELEACFQKGGGIPYSSYEGFHQMMNDMSAHNHNQVLLSHHVPSIETLVEKLEAGIHCLDVGCGMGLPSLLMGEKYPKSEFYGFDFSDEAIQKAKQEAERKGLKNVHFEVTDCAVFDSQYADKFDYISAHDAIHDQAKPADVLSGIYKMLKKDGIFSMVDVNAHSHPVDNIGHPLSTLMYTISLFHCMPVSLYFEGGAGLGTCWGKELALKMLQDAGFVNVKIKDYHKDKFNVNYLSTKQ